ncbi:hypothetical protein N9985_01695 [Gammaproteobacteria bacterium]|nr:hypothetical protein [Gammaproteobacteria bacterium]
MTDDNMKIFFGIPLWVFQTEHSEAINDKLQAIIKHEKSSDNGVHISNRGGWQSHGKLHQKETFSFFTDIVKNSNGSCWKRLWIWSKYRGHGNYRNVGEHKSHW